MSAEYEQPNDNSRVDNLGVTAALGKTSLNVLVFCSAEVLPDVYVKAGRDLARLIAESGHTFVWGGSDSGLMEEMVTSAQNAGGKIVGISVEFLRHKARKNTDEMVVAKDLSERKTLMLERSDIIVAMVGGIGTLDETTEIIEHKKHGHHQKPIIILNTNGFYDGLQTQLERMDGEGFLPLPLDELVYFDQTPQGVIDYINSLEPNES